MVFYDDKLSRNVCFFDLNWSRRSLCLLKAFYSLNKDFRQILRLNINMVTHSFHIYITRWSLTSCSLSRGVNFTETTTALRHFSSYMKHLARAVRDCDVYSCYARDTKTNSARDTNKKNQKCARCKRNNRTPRKSSKYASKKGTIKQQDKPKVRNALTLQPDSKENQ